jgi:hypothetical protein
LGQRLHAGRGRRPPRSERMAPRRSGPGGGR